MLASTLENVLNRGLPRSPRARQLCAELAGRRVGVEVRGLARFVVESTGDTLRVQSDAAGEADAEIAGGLLSLIAITSDSPAALIQSGQVAMRGDSDLAARFRELALLLRPDVEEELALVVGDVPAHQLGRLARGAFGWSRRAAATAMHNFAEFLAHERRDLVSRPEGEQFLKGVDILREDLDRISARIEHLGSSRAPGP